VNLSEWVIAIAIMLRVVGSTISLVGSGQRSIMAAANGSQRVGVWNPPLKVVLNRAGVKPMQLHWAPRHGVWVDCSFLPDTPCA